MYQNVMNPQTTVQSTILIFFEVERGRAFFYGAVEENRPRAQENNEPTNAWMDRDNFGEFVFLWQNFTTLLFQPNFLFIVFSKQIHAKYGAS